MASTPEAVKDKRNVSGRQLALVVFGLVVVLAAVWYFFLRGDGEETAPATAPAPAAAPEPESQAGKAGKRDGKGARAGKGDHGPAAPVETFEVFAPKDPFEPLVSTSTGGSTGTTAPSSSAPSTSTGGTKTSSSSSQSTSGDDVGGHTVRLVQIIDSSTAQVQVDGTVHRVSEGETFADSFQLVSINGNCASLLFGDDQFSLCEGEEILK